MMILKISTKQSKAFNKLIKNYCANYFNSNRLLLNDTYVQSISKTGIYCNYFKKSVLPIDKNLYEEIINQNKGKKCILCNSYFKSKANNQRYCLDCATKQKQSKAKERKRKQRALIFSLKAK